MALPGKAKQGNARQGKARQGKARQGKAKQGKARQGKARRRNANQVGARQGKPKQGDVADLLNMSSFFLYFLQKGSRVASAPDPARWSSPLAGCPPDLTV